MCTRRPIVEKDLVLLPGQGTSDTRAPIESIDEPSTKSSSIGSDSVAN